MPGSSWDGGHVKLWGFCWASRSREALGGRDPTDRGVPVVGIWAGLGTPVSEPRRQGSRTMARAGLPFAAVLKCRLRNQASIGQDRGGFQQGKC